MYVLCNMLYTGIMIIAVDIGGTKTIVAALGDSGRILSEERITTSHNINEFTKDLLRLLQTATQGQTPTAISIASAGLVDSQKGLIIHSPNLTWTNFPIRDALSQTYQCPIYLENDASIAALASVKALKTTPTLALYVTIGTGIGTSIIMNGHLYPALSRSEAGHMVFETAEGLKSWESFASGRAITKQLGRLAADITDPQDWQSVAEHLAVGLRTLIPAIRPDVVILGGGVGTYFHSYSKQLEQLLQEQIPKFIPLPTLVQANDPEKAVIHGCYHYVIDDRNNTEIAQTA